ncbi:uncharacterized protein LOC126734557 [Anthonomus grandis grandis]|uniref:uncharacterized protein LOC126734557 n=1 Tax=Anthonomus grandis grandis TaxID=2921223 RepID=UPI002165BF9A|nr:uncharacterized protein LOC126734557 [Anthonomus grandis grandis]
MAEDDAGANDILTDEGDSRPSSHRTRKTQQIRKRSPPQNNPKCRPRIEVLAIPNRRLILSLYQNHAYHFPRDKVEKIKILLQELYAMTPEETEKYFEHLRRQAEEIGRRKDIKFMLKRLLKRKKKAKQIKKAYDFINRLLIKGLEYASVHPVPPLVSVRLRNLSNIILEQICDLKNMNIPNRENPDQVGSFMLQVADWMAIAVEHLYYGVQLKKNRELEKIEKEAKTKVPTKKKVEPVQEQPEEVETGAVLSEPLSFDEME